MIQWREPNYFRRDTPRAGSYTVYTTGWIADLYEGLYMVVSFSYRQPDALDPHRPYWRCLTPKWVIYLGERSILEVV